MNSNDKYSARSLMGHWQTRNFLALSLQPISYLFCLITQGHRFAYRNNLLKSRKLPVPVVIIGNITVGGTGKTPLVIWLANYWRSKGWRPGVLTRGYLGTATTWPQMVLSDSDPQMVGDEAIILARRCGCPVVAGPDRWKGGKLLVDKYDCNLVLCDDGLQHYALDRDLEIVLIDGMKRLGNELCLPAGPLREPVTRLSSCDLVVINGDTSKEFGMVLQGLHAINLKNTNKKQLFANFSAHNIVAIAGIGNPERFFMMLVNQGLQMQRCVFPDHHKFSPQDFTGLAEKTVLMTEKDAVKCERFAEVSDNWWYVPVDAVPNSALIEKLDELEQIISYSRFAIK